MTVHYDHDQHKMSGILGFLEDLDVVVDSIGHLPSIGEKEDLPDGAGTPVFLVAINDINQRIRRTTGLPVDLKTVLPLAFVGAGGWSVARKGLMRETVPGWLFFWFAFDLFVKLHPARSGRREHSS